jgi:hypothetical protein
MLRLNVVRVFVITMPADLQFLLTAFVYSFFSRDYGVRLGDSSTP